MVKANDHLDVMVLGSHPCGYLAAALLRQNSAIRVTHVHVPNEALDERLVLINPELFELHPLLGGLKRKLELTAEYGLRFLADDSATHSEYAGKSIATYVASFSAMRMAMAKLARESGADLVENDGQLAIIALDERGVDVAVNGKPRKPRLLIIAADLPRDARRTLGLPDAWENGVVHRYSYLLLETPRGFDLGPKPLLPMSLDLKGQLTWAWLLPGKDQIQLAVEQPLEEVRTVRPENLMRHWIDVLVKHQVLKDGDVQDLGELKSIDLPLAGALSQEGVANRALLIGPAGGFYTACAEDLYPACWSAVFAAEAAKKALKERHLQDALQPYRQKWGATLGDYLRGPQQNLRFLLPLVYRNKMMTARLAEAILFGKSVVR
jgi:flavin-dependent dehydrogenase